MDNESNFSPEPEAPAPPQSATNNSAVPGTQPGQQQGQRNGRRGRGYRRRRRGQAGGGQQQSRGNGQGQSRQGGGQRRNRGQAFNGPMDHSYRQGENGNGNGNLQNQQGQNRNGGGRFRRFGRGGQQQRGNGNFQQQQRPSNFAYTEMEPLQISADAPMRIFVFVDDLFFTSKIQETAKKLGIKIGFVKTIEELSQKVEENGGDAPALIIFDLNGNTTKPLTTIPKLKAKFRKQTSIVGFVSHVQGELKVAAAEAGCDSVMPRSAFSQNLPNLLRRYAENEAEMDERQPENI